MIKVPLAPEIFFSHQKFPIVSDHFTEKIMLIGFKIHAILIHHRV